MLIEDGEKKDEETFPFICQKCRGIYECDVVIKGLCICPSCDKDKYDKEYYGEH